MPLPVTFALWAAWARLCSLAAIRLCQWHCGIKVQMRHLACCMSVRYVATRIASHVTLHTVSAANYVCCALLNMCLMWQTCHSCPIIISSCLSMGLGRLLLLTQGYHSEALAACYDSRFLSQSQTHGCTFACHRCTLLCRQRTLTGSRSRSSFTPGCSLVRRISSSA